MDNDWQYKLLLLVILFFFSAFFSGSEVAFFSLDKRKLKSDKIAPWILHYILNLIEHPRRLLVTILVGNTIVNVAASIVAVSLALEFSVQTNTSEELALTLQIIILTILILLFSEVTPKVLASKNPFFFTKISAFPLYWINVLLYPVTETLTELIKIAVSKVKFSKTKSAISPEELTELVNLGHEKGTIIEEEHELIHGIVHFRSVAVHEVMTPRMDIVAISVDTDFDELLKMITSLHFSRIPCYNDNLDEIVGIIYVKDLLPYLRNEELRKNVSLTKLSRKAMFIPKTKMISDLLHEFQEKKMHIAIVVDEYGGTAGLISLEDIIEEIIGEIRDEYDKEEAPVTKIDNNSFIALGKLSIDEMNELLNTNFSVENGDYETLAGLVLNHAGQIPKEGYSFIYENHKFTVKEILNKRIKKILIEKMQGE